MPASAPIAARPVSAGPVKTAVPALRYATCGGMPIAASAIAGSRNVGHVAPDGLVGSVALGFILPAPLLQFSLAGRAALQITATAALTINIELAAQAALTITAQPADLTIGYQLGGQVTEMGTAVARTIRVYDAASGALVGTTASDSASGEYFIDLRGHGADVYVQCLGSSAYGPLIHGPVTPDRR